MASLNASSGEGPSIEAARSYSGPWTRITQRRRTVRQADLCHVLAARTRDRRGHPTSNPRRGSRPSAGGQETTSLARLDWYLLRNMQARDSGSRELDTVLHGLRPSTPHPRPAYPRCRCESSASTHRHCLLAAALADDGWEGSIFRAGWLAFVIRRATSLPRTGESRAFDPSVLPSRRRSPKFVYVPSAPAASVHRNSRVIEAQLSVARSHTYRSAWGGHRFDPWPLITRARVACR